MKNQIRLQEYLVPILGNEGAISPCREFGELPLYLQRYPLSQMKVLGQEVILAEASEQDFSPQEFSRFGRNLEEHLGKRVIFVFDSLPVKKRNSLFHARVAFIVPGNQFFLPPVMDFREWAVRDIPLSEKLGYAAQFLVIRELVYGDVSRYSLKELAALAGYSAMAMTNAAAELVKRNFAEFSENRRPKSILFLKRGKELWNSALPVLRSPVKKMVWNRLIPAGATLAGFSALALYSMMASEKLPVYALSAKQADDPARFVPADSQDEAQSRLQIWYYVPISDAEGRPERFSLYLSLRDDHDPRVEDALESMMEQIKWK